MPLIPDDDRKFLRDYFSRELADPVRIVYFTQHESKMLVPGQECMYCKETRELLQEVADLSDKIEMEVHDFVGEADLARQHGVDKIPATIITGKSKGRVRFFGIPSGYEFSALIEAISDVSKGATDLSDETRKQLTSLTQDLHIQVFTTPT